MLVSTRNDTYTRAAKAVCVCVRHPATPHPHLTVGIHRSWCATRRRRPRSCAPSATPSAPCSPAHCWPRAPSSSERSPAGAITAPSPLGAVSQPASTCACATLSPCLPNACHRVSLALALLQHGVPGCESRLSGSGGRHQGGPTAGRGRSQQQCARCSAAYAAAQPSGDRQPGCHTGGR